MGEPRYTEKEMVMAKREAAACVMAYLTARGWLFTGGGEWPGSLPLAVELFPLPKVERPRVVTDRRGVSWRVSGGFIQVQYENDVEWSKNPAADITPERVRIWADLLAHPSEFVDDEG